MDIFGFHVSQLHSSMNCFKGFGTWIFNSQTVMEADRKVLYQMQQTSGTQRDRKRPRDTICITWLTEKVLEFLGMWILKLGQINQTTHLPIYIHICVSKCQKVKPSCRDKHQTFSGGDSGINNWDQREGQAERKHFRVFPLLSFLYSSNS